MGATGYPCLALRGPVGAWCGYVGVPVGHAAYGLSYYESDFSVEEVLSGAAAKAAPVQAKVNDLTVHGGLTFSGERDVEGDFHWFGFDCAHAGDYSPKCDPLNDPVLGLGAETGWGTKIAYRDLAYVEDQCRSLAAQLKAIDV